MTRNFHNDVRILAGLPLWPASSLTRGLGLLDVGSGTEINGRKRHILSDISGLLIGATVHEADPQDRDGAPEIGTSPKTSRL